MGVLAGFDTDMFVSYAHQDNVPATGRQSGWVDTLVRELVREVRQRLGRKDFTHWMDYQIDENRPLGDEIFSAVQKSAILLVVMSPTYLNSTWCKDERNRFLTALKNRVERGDVFVVEQFPIEHDKYPGELGNPKGFKFWIADDRTGVARALDIGLGASSELAEQFIASVVNLSEKVAKHIRLRTLPKHEATAAQRKEEVAPCVFVARATEDLEDREEELRAYLAQMEIRVLPETRYPQTHASEFEKAMLADMANCQAYVQLLSTFRGQEPDFAPGRRYAAYQYEIAQRSGKPLLLWRDRGMATESVKDPAHQRLLEQARACGIEEFKRTVCEEARRTPPQRRESSKVMVFVNTDVADRALAHDVGQALQSLTELEVYYPLTSGSPEDVRTDFEETLQSCDGVLLIYGTASARWIRNQLQQSRKVIARRDQPLNGLAVFHGPPPEDKGDLGVEMRNLINLDCRKGINPSILKNFIDTLRPSDRSH